MKVFTYFKRNKAVTFLLMSVIVLIITNLKTLSEYQSVKGHLFHAYVSVPDIELEHMMAFYGVTVLGGEVLTSSRPGMKAVGEINGFVTFIDEDDQPHGLRQYYTLNASADLDDNGNQIFYLTETLKMTHVSERKTDPEPFYVIQDNRREMLLESEGGARIGLDKVTQTVVLDDGEAYLITSDYDFSELMESIHK